MAALALPMMSQSVFPTKFATKQATITQVARHTDSPVIKSSQAVAQLRDGIPANMALITLAADDVWEDGTGYQMLLDADHDTYGSIIPDTGPLSLYSGASSEVYGEFEYKIPENADGDLYTENVIVTGSVSILVPAGVYDYCITNPEPGYAIWIASNYGETPGRYDNFEFEGGVEYYFEVKMTEYGYDGVFLTTFGEPVGAPPVPEGIIVVPTDHSAYAQWDIDEDYDQVLWNLRYRPYEPTTPVEYETYFWDFEDETELSWTSVDADGDSFGWFIWDPESLGYDTGDGVRLLDKKCATSASYNSLGALTPDDWMISPKVVLNGKLSFWAAGQDPSYAAEVFAVYVSTTDTELSSFVKISEDITATSPIQEYTIDLSEYEGMEGYVAFRHYNVTDMFRLNIDNVKIGSDRRANEWINVNNVETPFITIEDLTPETTYELQVQAYNAYEESLVSDWSESVIFTTLPEQAPQGQTASPEVVTTPDDDFYTFTGQVKEGDPEAEVTLFILDEDGNRVEVTNPFVVDRTEEDQIITIIAVAHIDGQIDGETVITVLVPAKVVTGIDEMISGKTVAGVRYYNMAGQEMQQANGMTIVVTTYTDGTTTAVKVMK